MKIKKLSILFMLMIITCLLSNIASATIYSTEDFEGDTDESDPLCTWYTYSEYGWNWANVTITDKHAGSQSFIINDTDGGSERSYFNVTSDSYDYFSFWFKYINTSNNDTDIFFFDSSGNIIANVTITLQYFTFRNWTQDLINTTITNNSWYKFVLIFNYTTNMMHGVLYNSGETLVKSAWGLATDGDGEIDYSNFHSFEIRGNRHKGTYIFIDDMTLAWTYVNPNLATNDLIVYTISIMFAIAILLIVVSFMYSGSASPESLISLLIAIIIGIIALFVISGL